MALPGADRGTRQLTVASLKLDAPIVMGILNVTPDSFSDGGRFSAPAAALSHGRAMVADGAGIIDIGGESTRPGSAGVDERTEIARVVPLIEALSRELPVPVSIDTSKPGVMRAAVAAGASIINDVRALRTPGALEAAADTGASVCLMHMQGEPRTMQTAPTYTDVVADVAAFLRDRIAACQAAGIARDRLIVDPGFGFGKTLAHNLALLARLDAFAELGVPLLAGLSRKSMLGTLTGRAVDERVAGSVALAALAVRAGASIIRAHDVAPTVDAVRVAAAVRGHSSGG